MEPVFKPKLFTVLKKGYMKEQFTKDLFAGIIVGIVALPLAIAFAVASGVSPDKGLITAIVAGFIIAVMGGSRVQIGGPTGAFIIIVYGIIEQYGIDGLIISSVLAGVMMVIFGLLKLGALLKFIPFPLVVGFTSGIALTIFSTQVKDALGLQIDKVPSDFIGKWGAYISALDTTSIYALGITVATILISVYFKKITTKIPGSFVAIILVTAVATALKLPVTSIESVFGEIPKSFNFAVPHFDLSMLGGYFAPALTIALLGSIESLLSAVVADGMIGGHHRSNTELIAQGVANIVTPFFGGIPATGAIARTATNVRSGGRTPVAGIVHVITLLLIMLFFGQWAKLIPMSCLAGILIMVAYNMSEWRNFVSILHAPNFDRIVLVVTFLLTVLIDLTVAIEVGVVLSALLFMKRMSETNSDITASIDADLIELHPDISKEIGIYEISGPFFFASAKAYCEVIKSMGNRSKIMIIRMRHVPFVDSTGLNNLRDTVENLHHSGIVVLLSGVRPSVANELERSGLTKIVGEENVLSSFDIALEKANELLKSLKTA